MPVGFASEPGLDIEVRPRRRPVMPVLAGLAIGIALADSHAVATWMWFVAAVLVLASVAAAVRTRPSAVVGWLLALVAAAVSGGLYADLRGARTDTHLERLSLDGESVYLVRGSVREAPRAFFVQRPFARDEEPIRRWMAAVDVHALAGQGGAWMPTAGGLTVFVDGGRPDLLPGDRVEFLARPRTNRSPTNPGERDMGRVYARLGSHGTAAVASRRAFHVVRRPGWWRGPRIAVGRLRHYLESRLAVTLAHHDLTAARPLISALLFGRRDLLEPDLREALQRSGTFHFLAISGLHVGIFAVFVGMLLTASRVSVRPRIVLTVCIVWAYVLFTGLQISSVRAALMITFMLAAPLVGRRYDALSAMGAAAVLILLVDPGQLFMPGFQLTFTAVWAIVCIYPQISGIVWPWRDFLERAEQAEEMSLRRVAWLSVRSYLLLSVTVWLATAPLLAWHFGYVSFLAPLLNLVVWPLVLVLLLTCFALCLLLPFGASVAGPVATAAYGLTWLLREAVTGAAFLPGYGVPLPALPVWWIAGCYAVLVAWTFRGRMPRGHAVVAAGAAVLAVAFVWQGMLARSREGYEIVFADVGAGQAVAGFCPSGQVFLFDAGARAAGRSRIITDLLRDRRVSEVSAVVVSHPDADHCNFVPPVAEHVRVRRVLMAPSSGLSGQGTRVREGIQALDVDVRSAARGAVITAGEMTGAVLHPDTRFLQRPTVSDNDQSMVVRTQWGGCSMLFTGDIEAVAMARLVSEQGHALSSDILVMPHHGHYAEGLAELVRAVDPRVAVVSGEMADCDPRTAAVLEDAGVPLWITGREGAIIVRVGARSFAVRGHASGREESYPTTGVDAGPSAEGNQDG